MMKLVQLMRTLLIIWLLDTNFYRKNLVSHQGLDGFLTLLVTLLPMQDCMLIWDWRHYLQEDLMEEIKRKDLSMTILLTFYGDHFQGILVIDINSWSMPLKTIIATLLDSSQMRDMMLMSHLFQMQLLQLSMLKRKLESLSIIFKYKQIITTTKKDICFYHGAVTSLFQTQSLVTIKWTKLSNSSINTTK